MWALLTLREWRHHPWRQAMAAAAVALGVALSASVHWINSSALAEFSAAVRSANGEPDVSLRPAQGARLPDGLLTEVQQMEAVAVASPVLEFSSYARASSGRADSSSLAVRVLGVDALVAASVAAGLRPALSAQAGRFSLLDEAAVLLSASARQALGLRDGEPLWLLASGRWRRFEVLGSVALAGAPAVVVDVAAAQAFFGAEGQLSRIDVRLQPGQSATGLNWPPGLRVAAADEAEQRVSQLSRAYRVNLSVLALVALFVGGFLVYSVQALAVAQRVPALALLGVLGFTAGQRRRLVLGEAALLGALGGLVGLALGAGLAWAALRWMAGDLGGGYFPGVAPPLHISAWSVLAFFGLGVLAALLGAWVPAQQARAIAPAQALKGLGQLAPWRGRGAWAVGLMVAGVLLAMAPPMAGLPLAAYAAVAALLVGGVAAVPWVVDLLLKALPAPHHALPLLALARARHARALAGAAVAGVVASLALCVALSVMVASFRTGVDQWLGQVLPADLYLRSGSSAALSDQAFLDPEFVRVAQAQPAVASSQTARVVALPWQPDRPAVSLIARELGDDVAQALPLLDPPLSPASALRSGELGVYVSEAMVTLYNARVGERIALPMPGRTEPVQARVLGVWRDYARQFGAVVMPLADYRRLSGDMRLNEMSLWLAPGQDLATLQASLRQLAPRGMPLQFASAPELRALSLAIFDRSFAVTTYLQAVAIAIGVVGIAASLSAQVLARRKEFGLLAHLGLRRNEILRVVCGEVLAWLCAGVLLGLLLGLAISVVLVHVVNPQSFHWTMPLVLPPLRLAALVLAMLLAGVMAAALSARHAARRSAVLSVKEDW
jgi:putative ABC transport system permease protein